MRDGLGGRMRMIRRRNRIYPNDFPATAVAARPRGR